MVYFFRQKREGEKEMKLIHTADLHLGSRIESKFPPDKAERRRIELRDSFARMIERAKERGAGAILIVGDAFDTDPATPADAAFFFGAIRANPCLTFLYLRGNHDKTVDLPGDCPNLVTFGDKWTTWEKDGVAVSGIEMSRENCETLYDGFSPVAGKVNIVMLHGRLGSSPAPDTVVLSKLSDRGIDYLALGDYHARQDGKLGARGAWAYPGCPEGRGFDEPGEKGFLCLTAENGVVTREFVPHACRTLHEIDCDVSGAGSDYEAAEIARRAIAAIPEKDPIRVNLIGAVGFDRANLARVAEERLKAGRFFVSVKDKTKVALDLDAIRGELSLRGEYLRLIDAEERPEDEKSAILELGLRALSDEDLG